MGNSSSSSNQEIVGSEQQARTVPPVLKEDVKVMEDKDFVLNPHTGKMEALSGGCPFAAAEAAKVDLNANAQKAAIDTNQDISEVCPFKPVPGSKADLNAQAAAEDGEKEECPFKPVPGSMADITGRNMDIAGLDGGEQRKSVEKFPRAVVSEEDRLAHDKEIAEVSKDDWKQYCQENDRTKYFRIEGNALTIDEISSVALRRIHFDNVTKESVKHIILTYNPTEKLIVDAIVNGINEETSRLSSVPSQIMTVAGPQLLVDCFEYVSSTACVPVELLVSKSYDLPCMYVIHTHIPQFEEGKLNEHNTAIAAMYLKCMETADSMGLKSIAFPCLGCGSDAYPTETHPLMLQRLALKFLRNSSSSLQYVVFSFTDEQMAFLYQMNFTSLMELTWFPQEI